MRSHGHVRLISSMLGHTLENEHVTTAMIFVHVTNVIHSVFPTNNPSDLESNSISIRSDSDLCLSCDETERHVARVRVRHVRTR